MWNFALHDTISGALEAEFPAAATGGGSWAARLETGGTVTGVLKVTDRMIRDLGQPVMHELTDPTGEFQLVVKCEGTLVAAGVVLDSDYDRDAGTLTLKGKDLGDVFWPGRMSAGVNNKTGGSLAIVGRTYEAAARAILARAMQWATTWQLPVDLPPDGPGGYSAAWDWWEFRTIQEMLDQIRAEGIQIHHAPYLTAGNQLRHTTSVVSTLMTGRVPLSATASKSPVVGLKYNRRGSQMVTGVQAVGNGKGSGVLTAYAGNPLPGIPIRDSYVAGGEITEVARLQRIATTEHARNATPAREWAMAVQADDRLHPSMFLPGAVIDLDVRSDPIIPDGVHALQVVALSGDVASRRVTPEVIPYAG